MFIEHENRNRALIRHESAAFRTLDQRVGVWIAVSRATELAPYQHDVGYNSEFRAYLVSRFYETGNGAYVTRLYS